MKSVHFQIAAALASGILLGGFLALFDILIFLFFYVLILLISFAYFRKEYILRFILIGVIFALGVLVYNMANSEYFRKAYRFSGEYVTIGGKVCEIPEYGEDYNTYIVNVKAVLAASDKNKLCKVNERVKISTDGEFKFGESIIAEGFLKPFSEKLNSGDFDSARNNKAKGIYFHMSADFAEVSQAEYRSYSPAYFATFIKNKVVEAVNRYYSGDEAAILCAVLTGYKGGFSKELEDRLYDTNTMRMFYPSYIHISIIIMLISALKPFAEKRKRDLLLIFALCVYAFFNFNYHYIIKSALLVAAVLYSKRTVGFSNYIDLLCMLVFMMLIVNPLMAYETGFVLSVISNVLIFFFVPHVNKRLCFIRGAAMRRAVSVWLVLSVLMIPFQSYFFYCATPYAMLLNIIYIPIVTFMMFCMPIDFVLSALGFTKNPCAFLGNGLILFVKSFPSAVEKLPFYIISVKRPGIVVLIIYAALLFILYKALWRRVKGSAAVFTAACVAIGLSLSVIIGFVPAIGKLRIDFVSLGQNEGAVLSVPFHENIIIDGGGMSEFSEYDYGEEIFIPYLERNGFYKIDAAVVSHYHSDHCVGVIDAMKKLRVKEVIIPDYGAENEYRSRIEEIAAEKNIKVTVYSAGGEIEFPSGLRLEVISPGKDELESFDENEKSLVIRASYGDFSAIFTGDTTSEAERRHLGEFGDCDVLKVAHHGSATSTSEEFLQETKPEAAVISVGLDNTYYLPKEYTLEKLNNIGAEVYRTDKNGNIILYANKSGKYTIRSYK